MNPIHHGKAEGPSGKRAASASIAGFGSDGCGGGDGQGGDGNERFGLTFHDSVSFVLDRLGKIWVA
jgi:hypothetical protein